MTNELQQTEPTPIQEQVRQAGRMVKWTRIGVFTASMLPPAILAVWAAAVVTASRYFTEWGALTLALLTWMTSAAFVSALIALPAAALCRCLSSARLRRQLAGLSVEERAAALHPLIHERTADARQLAFPLLRELVANAEKEGIGGEASGGTRGS